MPAPLTEGQRISDELEANRNVINDQPVRAFFGNSRNPAALNPAAFSATATTNTQADTASAATETPAEPEGPQVPTQGQQQQTPELVEGTEFTPTPQAVQEAEQEEVIMLGDAPTITAQRITGPDGIQVPLIEALQVGDLTPEAQAQIGTINPNALVEAAQAAGIPDVEIPNILRRANIDAATIAATPEVQAVQGELSAAATATAVTGTESEEFAAAAAEERQRLIDFPVDPNATVREQYNQLMADVDGGTPPWAAAALRAANAQLASRGLGSSSIAAEGITSALMQAALPIATQDAQVFRSMGELKFSKTAAIGAMRISHIATLDQQNLTNRQEAAMKNAQSALQVDLTNMNNAQQTNIVNAQLALQRATSQAGLEQEASIEEARQNLQIDTSNLNANTAAAIQNAQSALTIETANLSARQQAQVENAKAFLSMDLTNLSNAQKTSLFNAQSRLQTLMSDQAAVNSARHTNASNQLETDRFMRQMSQRTKEYNAAMAMDADKFNSTMQNQREQFNVANQMAVQRSNIDYLRRVNTANTALENQANLVNSQNLLDISNTAMANMIQQQRDEAARIFSASESADERANRLAIAQLAANTNMSIADKARNARSSSFLGSLASDVLGGITGGIGNAISGAISGG